MLGTLAGISIAFISMRPAAQMWQAPWIAFVAFAFILVGWLGGGCRRRPVGLLGGLVATAVAWMRSSPAGATSSNPRRCRDSSAISRCTCPSPPVTCSSGCATSPLAGDGGPAGHLQLHRRHEQRGVGRRGRRPLLVRQCSPADGIGAIVGSFLGSPFPPAVYIGHPGWKQVGGRIGYSLVTGIVVAVVCFTGLVGTFLAIFPMQALVPVLLYIGLVIGAQAYIRRACGTPGNRAGDPAEPGPVGHRSDRQCARGRRHQRPRRGARQADRGRRHLRRPEAARAGRGAGRHRARRDRLLRDRPAVLRRRDHLGDRRRAVLRRPGQRPGGEWNAAPTVTVGYLLLARSSPGSASRARGEVAASRDGLLFVNGTLMRGLELHRNLAGAELLEDRTAPATGCTASVTSTPACTGRATAEPPSPASCTPPRSRCGRGSTRASHRGCTAGRCELIDGRVVPGILFDEATAKTHPEITELGGWREYVSSKSDVSKS